MENKILEPRAMERLQNKIIYLENQNAKSQKLNFSQMVDKIRKMIEEEANAYKGN